MNVAMIHFHLDIGGVTQVVKGHLRSIRAMPPGLVPEQVFLLHGGQSITWVRELDADRSAIPITEMVVPGLSYDETSSAPANFKVLAKELERTLVGLGGTKETTVLHVHNHALGKNVSLPGALRELAARGFSLLLQIHDFVEDFRPANYRRLQDALGLNTSRGLTELLYPQGSHVHYAVLNRRDWAILSEAGVEASRLHLLPNPVIPPAHTVNRSTVRPRVLKQLGLNSRTRYILNPVRGIRRKNLGESLLWAAALKDDAAFGFTLPPLNPLEQKSYFNWRELAKALGLPCYFELGCREGISLTDNLAACDCVMSNSLAEGFGLVFLESYLSDRSVIGRDLPEITSDFVGEGMVFAGLEPRFNIPVDWVGLESLVTMWSQAYNATLKAYGKQHLTESDLKKAIDNKLLHGCVDFGDLNMELQQRILCKVCSDATAMRMLTEINPFLRGEIMSQEHRLSAEVARNSEIVRSRYSLDVCAQRLSDIYQRVSTSSRSDIVPLPAGERILSSFLNLPRFRPVRV